MKLNIKGTIVPNDYKHVYDYFGIESTSAKDVSDALDAANGQPLEVYINSGGGYVRAGNEIYTLLSEYGGGVNIKIIFAASAASIATVLLSIKGLPTQLSMMKFQALARPDGSVYHNWVPHATDSRKFPAHSGILGNLYGLLTQKRPQSGELCGLEIFTWRIPRPWSPAGRVP